MFERKEYYIKTLLTIYSATNFGMQNAEGYQDVLQLVFEHALPRPEDVKTRKEFIDYCKEYFAPIYKKLSEIRKNPGYYLHPIRTRYAKNKFGWHRTFQDFKPYVKNIDSKIEYTRKNALHNAIECNDVVTVWILIKAGADVNLGQGVFCETGIKPLSSAIVKGNLEIIKLLMAGGANPYAMTVGAKPYVQEENGERPYTPYDLAFCYYLKEKKGYKEIITYFNSLGYLHTSNHLDFQGQQEIQIEQPQPEILNNDQPIAMRLRERTNRPEYNIDQLIRKNCY